MNKPVVLSDLDDTLFQTRRKMVDELALEPFRPGALDRSLNARSFMTEEQSMLVDWLLEHADFIPVTARGTEEISRVTIPFRSWAIATHGAVILTPEGKADEQWRAHMLQSLAPYRERLLQMQSGITALMAERGIESWARLNYEYDETPIYLVMKHTDSTRIDELYALGDEIESLFPTEGFYIHRNSNNIAWLPTPVEKGLATQYLLTRLRAERGVFPVIGLGDSLSDHRFMKLCNWFGLPQQSQFAEQINRHIFGEK
jgi:hydroxymethylpyrimidine pyrophosphatase-like HAD family hydrolase